MLRICSASISKSRLLAVSYQLSARILVIPTGGKNLLSIDRRVHYVSAFHGSPSVQFYFPHVQGLNANCRETDGCLRLPPAPGSRSAYGETAYATPGALLPVRPPATPLPSQTESGPASLP